MLLGERQLQMFPTRKATFAPIGCASFQLCRQVAPPTNVAKMKQIFAPIGCDTFRRIWFTWLLLDASDSRKSFFKTNNSWKDSNSGDASVTCTINNERMRGREQEPPPTPTPSPNMFSSSQRQKSPPKDCCLPFYLTALTAVSYFLQLSCNHVLWASKWVQQKYGCILLSSDFQADEDVIKWVRMLQYVRVLLVNTST